MLSKDGTWLKPKLERIGCGELWEWEWECTNCSGPSLLSLLGTVEAGTSGILPYKSPCVNQVHPQVLPASPVGFACLTSGALHERP